MALSFGLVYIYPSNVDRFFCFCLDRRFNDHGNNRVVHAPTVRIAEPPTNGSNGVNAEDVATALTSTGGKGKKQKAYRR